MNLIAILIVQKGMSLSSGEVFEFTRLHRSQRFICADVKEPTCGQSQMAQ